MTGKRFTIDVETENYENAFFYGDKFICFEDDFDRILETLNVLVEENEQLKKQLKDCTGKAKKEIRKQKEENAIRWANIGR